MKSHNRIDTYYHSTEVADCASKLAIQFNVDQKKARVAGYLHDISAIYPPNERVSVANRMGIELCAEEIKFPLIIHQKISAVMAKSIFNVTDNDICSAIECHTTLKKNFSKLDLVLFVADKIAWDRDGTPPYLNDLLSNLEISLENAAYFYIQYLLKHDIKVVHPWLLEAYKQLKRDICLS